METRREIILAQVQASPGNSQQKKTPLPISSPVKVIDSVDIGRVKESIRVESLNGKPIIIEPSATIKVEVVDAFPQGLIILATLGASLLGPIVATVGLWWINKKQYKRQFKDQNDQYNRQLKDQKDQYERQLEYQNDQYERQLTERITEQQILTTLEIAREFDSESMWIARATAHKKFVRDNQNDIIPLNEHYKRLDPSELSPIFRVIYFYRRLDLLKQHGKIDEQTAQYLFSENYTWWYKNYLEYQLDQKDKWEDKDDWYHFIKYDWLLSNI